MTYTLLPNSGQSLGETRAPIRTNFDLLQQDLDKNHVSINDADRGKHKYVELKNQATIPAGLTAGEYTLYSKTSAVTARNQLFGTRSNLGQEVQFTEDLGSVIPLNTQNGGTFVAGQGSLGALIFLWGKVDASSMADGVSGTVNFGSRSFPSAILNVYMTLKYDSGGSTPTTSGTLFSDQNVGTFTASGFNWRFVSSATSTPYKGFYWLAIGY